MNEQIYVLIIGEYYYQEVVGVFSDKEKAEAAARLVDGNVEGPFQVDAMNLVDPGKPFWEFQIKRHGQIVSCREKTRLTDGTRGEAVGKRHEERYKLHEGGTETAPYDKKSVWRLRGGIYADTQEEVVKIANELRMQVLAGAKPKEGPIR